MQDYDYTTAGFDEFLSRSIDNNVQANLDSPAPPTTQLRYDSAQVTGIAGEIFRTTDTAQSGEQSGDFVLKGTLTVGNILIDGVNENIVLSDDSNKRLLIGREDGRF